MAKVLRVLRNGTRNQSTADFSRNNLFIFGQRMYAATVANTSATVPVIIEEGMLVKRNATDPTQIEPIVLTADLGKTIGILDINGEVTLAASTNTNAHFAYKGEVDGSLLVLPEASTLSTLVGDRTLKDLLTGLGFIVSNVAENSKFDN